LYQKEQLLSYQSQIGTRKVNCFYYIHPEYFNKNI
jgi:hypothetical protein